MYGFSVEASEIDTTTANRHRGDRSINTWVCGVRNRRSLIHPCARMVNKLSRRVSHSGSLGCCNYEIDDFGRLTVQT